MQQVLDSVCESYSITEKMYFGLAHRDESGDFVFLPLEKKVRARDSG